MAVNPITTEELTINFSDLLKIPVSDRVQAVMMSPDYSNALLNSLTPIQMAKAFPDYYRRELPDISNFILGNRYLDEKGAGAFHQKGGGDYGDHKTTATPLPPKTVVDKILESAQLYKTTGETGVTSAIQNEKGRVISTADVSMTANERALLDTIAQWEAKDYNTSVGGARFEDFSKHPNMAIQTKYGPSDAAGRYQFLESTWNAVVEKYNKENPDNPITDFSPVNQDRAALWLAKNDYKQRTGRDLTQDLANPPENFGELLKAGLGGGQKGPTDTTWQALQFKNAYEIQDVFNKNVEKNTEYAKLEAEEAAKRASQSKVQMSPELAEVLNSNPLAKKYFLEDKPEMGIRLQEQINAGITSIEKLKNTVRSNSQQIGELIRTTEEIAAIGGDAIVNQEQSRVKEDQAQLAGTRKLPLQQDLKNLMDYSAQMISEETGRNISMQVFSGGQAALGTAGPRTGSTEHDLGGAADVYYIETMPDGSTRKLNMKNPEDKKLMYKAAYYFARAGGRSVGLESGYMGDESMHLGISRNNEDPVHHGDQELEALISQGKNEFLTEARNSGWDTRYGYQNFLEKVRAARIAAYEEQNKTVAQTTNNAVAQTTNKPIFLGDSIADGMKNAVNGEGNTLKSRPPDVVLSEMQKMGLDYFKGREVVLSTGLSNNTVDLDSVRKQMEFLKQAGAKVKIAGMSNSREDLAPGNQQLQSMAEEYGYQFMGGFDAGEDLIHPKNYGEYLSASSPPVETYQYGGTPKTQDDENLSVYDESGSLRWKMNSGEGIYVKPEANEYADSKIEELSGRLDEISQKMDAQPNDSDQMQQRKPVSPRQEQRSNWSNKVIDADRPRSPSADRANRRTKFLNEGWRAGGWGSPNSITG